MAGSTTGRHTGRQAPTLLTTWANSSTATGHPTVSPVDAVRLKLPVGKDVPYVMGGVPFGFMSVDRSRFSSIARLVRPRRC